MEIGEADRERVDVGVALVLLATLLRRAQRGQVALSGLTHHQWRLLTYLGLAPGPVDAPGAAEA